MHRSNKELSLHQDRNSNCAQKRVRDHWLLGWQHSGPRGPSSGLSAFARWLGKKLRITILRSDTGNDKFGVYLGVDPIIEGAVCHSSNGGFHQLRKADRTEAPIIIPAVYLDPLLGASLSDIDIITCNVYNVGLQVQRSRSPCCILGGAQLATCGCPDKRYPGILACLLDVLGIDSTFASNNSVPLVSPRFGFSLDRPLVASKILPTLCRSAGLPQCQLLRPRSLGSTEDQSLLVQCANLQPATILLGSWPTARTANSL